MNILTVIITVGIIIAGTILIVGLYLDIDKLLGNEWTYIESISNGSAIRQEVGGTSSVIEGEVDASNDSVAITATVTAFNTVEEQTDDRPCESASGDWICGRDDVVACPPHIPFHTWIEIDGKLYECLDRTAVRYNHRFDISFDKDIEGALNFGIQEKAIKIINN